MAFDGQERVVAIHAGAVVAHPDQAPAAVHHLGLDARGPGIDRVFDQLFEGRGGPLDNLAGGDLVDHRIGQHADGSGTGHGRWL